MALQSCRYYTYLSMSGVARQPTALQTSEELSTWTNCKIPLYLLEEDSQVVMAYRRNTKSSKNKIIYNTIIEITHVWSLHDTD